MAQLQPATVTVHQSFLAAMDEFVAEGRGSDDDLSMLGADLRQWAAVWREPTGFASYVAAVSADEREDTPRPAGYVPATTWWLIDNGGRQPEFLGRITLRHRLTPALLERGGHIGYDVRPSARRRGHATAMLRGALAHAHTMGIESALLTCDVDNVASRRTIERCGGRFEDERAGKLRFWIPTAAFDA